MSNPIVRMFYRDRFDLFIRFYSTAGVISMRKTQNLLSKYSNIHVSREFGTLFICFLQHSEGH